MLREDSIRIASEAACKEAQLFDSQSSLRRDSVTDIEYLKSSDVQVGKLLGLGNFSSVNEASYDEKKFAIKTLRNKNLSNDAFRIGAIDLLLESKILQKLQHENIIRLHGVSHESPEPSDIPSYFLVLERLDGGTLDQAMWKWRQFYQQQEKLKRSRHESDLIRRRTSVLLGIARGLEYLHSHNIVYRDLKPQNVGFNREGKVLIFDFGLARDLDPENCSYKGRKLTGQVGTPRYMAPENALGLEYGLSSDIYSLSILCWEVLTLKVAYQNITVDQVLDKICRDHHRPSLRKTNGSISPKLKSILQQGWDPKPEKRPDIKTICSLLACEEDENSLSSDSSTKNILRTMDFFKRGKSPRLGCKERKKRKMVVSSILKASAA